MNRREAIGEVSKIPTVLEENGLWLYAGWAFGNKLAIHEYNFLRDCGWRAYNATCGEPIGPNLSALFDTDPLKVVILRLSKWQFEAATECECESLAQYKEWEGIE